MFQQYYILAKCRRSPVYVWRDGQFRLDHHVATQGASDVEPIALHGTVWLTIATGLYIYTITH